MADGVWSKEDAAAIRRGWEDEKVKMRPIPTPKMEPAFCNGGYARSFREPCVCGARGSEACRATFK